LLLLVISASLNPKPSLALLKLALVLSLLEIGLVSIVVSKDELLSQAMWYGAKIGGNAPVAVKLAKKATHMAYEEGYENNLKYQVEAAIDCFKTKDLAEGIAAILEKRRGKFIGE
jgi:enoyl-CoA hydratase/carnithine racemase